MMWCNVGLEFFETSAKDNVNVKAVFERLVDIICDKMSESLDAEPSSAIGNSSQTRQLTASINNGQGSSCACWWDDRRRRDCRSSSVVVVLSCNDPSDHIIVAIVVVIVVIVSLLSSSSCVNSARGLCSRSCSYVYLVVCVQIWLKCSASADCWRCKNRLAFESDLSIMSEIWKVANFLWFSDNSGIPKWPWMDFSEILTMHRLRDEEDMVKCWKRWDYSRDCVKDEKRSWDCGFRWSDHNVDCGWLLHCSQLMTVNGQCLQQWIADSLFRSCCGCYGFRKQVIMHITVCVGCIAIGRGMPTIECFYTLCLQKNQTPAIFRNNFAKTDQLSTVFGSCNRYSLTTDCWYVSRTSCVVSIETIALLHDGVPAECGPWSVEFLHQGTPRFTSLGIMATYQLETYSRRLAYKI